MKKSVLLLIVGLGLTLMGKTQNLDDHVWKLTLKIEGSDRKAGLGFQYTLREQWAFPFMVGLGEEFQERKWNDWYMEIWPHYLFGQGKWCIPLGIVGGVRFMNDYGHHFPAFFVGGAGGVLYRLKCHEIGINVGVKYGKRHHLLQHSEEWGKVSGRETYREKPFFFTIYYLFSTRGRR